MVNNLIFTFEDVMSYPMYDILEVTLYECRKKMDKNNSEREEETTLHQIWTRSQPYLHERNVKSD